MGAKGKINASTVQAGDRIIVLASKVEGRVNISRTKTGEGVHVARVIRKDFRSAQGPYERQGRYIVQTTSGTFEAAPVETMWLAPEDAAGIKRAHVEALVEDAERAAEREALAEDFRTSGALDDAHAEALAEDFRTSGALDDAALTLHSQDGKVDNMNNDANTAQAETAPATSTENYTGSTVVRLLEKVWARIREDHPELPEVVIITGSGLLGGSKWGHFRADGWKVKEEGAALRKHELFLAGEALAKGAAQVLQTMLHEGAHTLASVRDLKDTSRQGRWHNATFRKLAEEMGLEHKGTSADSSHGFSFVTLTQATRDRYADLLAELDAEIKLTCHLPVWLGGTAEGDEDKGGERITGKPKGEGDENKPKSGPLKATCSCDEPLIIRLSQTTLDLRVVRCDKCDELFTAA